MGVGKVESEGARDLEKICSWN